MISTQNPVVVDFLRVCIVLLVFLLLTVALWCFNNRTQYSHDLATCQDLLQASNLAKRAAPNERFRIAFGIENAFTTTDHSHYQVFRGSIENGLDEKNTDESRLSIANAASQTIKDLLERERDIGIKNLVKTVVFRTILSIFFPEVLRPSTADVEFLTHTIDSLWYDAKSPIKIFLAQHVPRHSGIRRKREDLHLKLKQLFFPHISPSEEIPPRSNPLNILLPAYTGVWKVVLNGLMEVRFCTTSQHQTSAYRTLLSTFITSPTNVNWYKPNKQGISVQAIIAETMRLYPPTRRIYTLGDDGIKRAVNIEALHRTGDIWGENPDDFDPARWAREGLSVIETKEYMPFGSKGPSVSRCPSRKRGGPKLCAILLGTLIEGIGENLELADGESEVLLPEILGKRRRFAWGRR